MTKAEAAEILANHTQFSPADLRQAMAVMQAQAFVVPNQQINNAAPPGWWQRVLGFFTGGNQ